MVVSTVAELATRYCADIRGNSALEIRGVGGLDKAGPHEISFALEDKHVRSLKTSRAGACFVSRRRLAEPELQNSSVTLLFVDDPQDAFLAVLQEFRPQPARAEIGISPAAHVHPTAQIGAGTNVYPGAFVDAGAIIGEQCDLYPGVYVGRDCRIGNRCTLYPHAVLYANVVLGDRCILHAQAVLGADGFGYRFREGHFEKIPQLGSVLVEDDCEIGACTTIDRGMIGATVVGEGTKLDNLVMIGHNCELGKHNAFASQVGLAGSVTTGDFVRCAGQVGIRDHVHLGTGAVFLAKAGVHKDMPGGETYIGAPAGPEQEQFKVLMSLARLPEMRKQLRELQQQVANLERQLPAEVRRAS